jgi:hypothetical protein
LKVAAGMPAASALSHLHSKRTKAMKLAITVKAFSGAPDGSAYPQDFTSGDPVSGELAEVAITNKWAKSATQQEFDEATALRTPAANAEDTSTVESRQLAVIEQQLATLAKFDSELKDAIAKLQASEEINADLKAQIEQLTVDLAAATAPSLNTDKPGKDA